nr:Rid family hydrolase [Pseudomarimonas arenosa]
MSISLLVSGCVSIRAERGSAEATATASPAPSREHFAPPGWAGSYHQFGYTPVVRVGDQVIVSGIPAAVGNSYEERVEWMYQQLKAHLQAAGAELADVVELSSFHTEPTDTASFQAEFRRYLPIHRKYFPDHYPAWSAVGTTALLAEGAPVELRAVAIIGSGRQPRSHVAPPVPPADPGE